MAHGALYRPGDAAPSSGVYVVSHDCLDGIEHAAPHEVTIIQGKPFPPCRVCQQHVRFRLACAATHIDADPLFRPPEKVSCSTSGPR